MEIFYISGGILLIIIYIFLYNSLTSSLQNVKEAWSGIDVQLKRRHDLIPNLIETVKGYAKHEEKLFAQVSEERAKALSTPTSNVTELGKVEKKIDSTLKSIIAIAEAYPDLKADAHFLNLQQQLSETEDQIASARRIYNSNVADYNTHIRTFPSMIIAGIHGFKLSPFFENETES